MAETPSEWQPDPKLVLRAHRTQVKIDYACLITFAVIGVVSLIMLIANPTWVLAGCAVLSSCCAVLLAFSMHRKKTYQWTPSERPPWLPPR